MNLTRRLILLFLLAPCLVSGQNKVRLPAWSFQDDHTTIVGMSVGLTSQDVQVNTIGLKFELLGEGFELLDFRPPHDAPAGEPLENIYGLNISPCGTNSQNVKINGLGIAFFGTSVNQANGMLVTWPGIGHATTMNGLQVSFLFNYASVMNGIQVGTGNFCEEKSIGLQIGGGNESASHTGLQIALYNKAMAISAGLQISLVNIGEDFRGVQIGLINKTQNLRGLQIGLVNVNGKRFLPFINW